MVRDSGQAAQVGRRNEAYIPKEPVRCGPEVHWVSPAPMRVEVKRQGRFKEI